MAALTCTVKCLVTLCTLPVTPHRASSIAPALGWVCQIPTRHPQHHRRTHPRPQAVGMVEGHDAVDSGCQMRVPSANFGYGSCLGHLPLTNCIPAALTHSMHSTRRSTQKFCRVNAQVVNAGIAELPSDPAADSSANISSSSSAFRSANVPRSSVQSADTLSDPGCRPRCLTAKSPLSKHM